MKALILLLLGCRPASTPVHGQVHAPDTGTDTALIGHDTATVESCQPVITFDKAHVVEGDTVQGTLSCASGAPSTDFEVAPQQLPGDMEFASDWTLSWTTGLADAGTYDLLVAVWPRSGGKMPESATATLSVADAWDNPDNVAVDPASYTSEWGIPVIDIEPSSSPNRSEYVPATVWWAGKSYTAEIKIHGATSTYYPKQSYALPFKDEKIDLSEVGLDHRDHVYLITTFDDNSYVRQKLAYDTWKAIAGFWGAKRLTPRTFFVVVYFDEAYYGLYTGVDRVDNEFVDHMGFDKDGNLYKSINHDANFYLTDANGQPKSLLHDGYEKKEGDPTDFSDLDALVAFTGGSDTDTLHAGLPDRIDREEFMDWFLFVHWTSSDDSGGKNAYLYHDPETDRWRYAPWDFNHSFGQNWYTARIPYDQYDDFVWANAIFAHFQAQDDDATELWDRFAQLGDGGPLDGAVMRSTIEGYFDLMDDSAQRDWEKWGAQYQSYWASVRSDDLLDYTGERAYLEQWLADRDAYMRSVH